MPWCGTWSRCGRRRRWRRDGLTPRCWRWRRASHAPPPAIAQDAARDTRPIRWLIGLPAGSGPDLLTRLLTERLAVLLGRPIVIENRPGAAGNVAAAALARAAPDGTTLGTLIAATVAINRHLYPDLGFDPARDFTPISHFGMPETDTLRWLRRRGARAMAPPTG